MSLLCVSRPGASFSTLRAALSVTLPTFLLATGVLTLAACTNEEPSQGGSAGTGGAAGSGGAPSAGSAGTDSGGSGGDTSQAWLPWKTGFKWTYRVITDTGTTEKTTTVQGLERVGAGPHAAKQAFKVVTTKSDGRDKTVSWQAVSGDKVLRFREQSYSASTGELTLDTYWDPYKLHVDGTAEHTRAEASWYEEYQETDEAPGAAPVTTTKKDRWLVEAVEQRVTVPAGTFEHVLVLTKAAASSQKTYYYVRGVGKIKETGGQTEELVSYSVEP
jgi:hypothetical protein